MNKVVRQDQFRLKKVGIALVIALHVVGAVGFLSPLSEWFVFLTPINLIITAGMIWIDSKPWSVLGWPVALTIILLGYLVEIIGVKTGVIFGEYSYGEVLGWKFFEVPPLIGINWLIIIWGGFSLLYSLGIPSWARWFLVGVVAVAIDLLIEPVAIYFEFWTWDSDTPPLRNYVAWFLVACLMGVIFEKYPLVQKPRLGVVALVCQFLFFAVLLYAIR